MVTVSHDPVARQHIIARKYTRDLKTESLNYGAFLLLMLSLIHLTYESLCLKDEFSTE
jgi:hypothetical protein